MKTLHSCSSVVLFLLVLAGVCHGLEIKKAIMYDDSAYIIFDCKIHGHTSIEAPAEMVPESLALVPLKGGVAGPVSVEPSIPSSGRVKDLQDALARKRSSLSLDRRAQAMLERQIDIIYDAAGSKGKAASFDKPHLSDALSFIENRVTALNSRLVALTDKAERLETEIKDLKERLNKISQNPGYRINITGNGLIEISYVIKAASWRPEYLLHASPDALQLIIVTSALARQTSGMDWDIDELLVSTGRPGFGIQAPELQAWHLSKRPRHDARLKAESADMAKEVGSQPVQAAEAPVEITSTSYLIGAAKRIHLSGDGTPVTVQIGKQPLKADFSLVSVPRYNLAAFLRADATLKGDSPLMPGAYSSFVDGAYSGKGVMKRFEPGQKISLDLGVDEGIKVWRKETQAFSDKTLSGKERITYSYEITIENTRNKGAFIAIKDQIPISLDKSISVDLIKTDPEATPDQDGILTWKFELEPHQKKKAVFSFAVIGTSYMPY